MLRWLTHLFVFVYCFCNYSFCDRFYIFDVGQGNCQLAIFDDKEYKIKIGVLYDCGSSSWTEHVKITALKKNDYHPIYIKKKEEEKPINESVKTPKKKKGNEVKKEKITVSQSSDESEDVENTSTESTEKIKKEEEIKKEKEEISDSPKKTESTPTESTDEGIIRTRRMSRSNCVSSDKNIKKFEVDKKTKVSYLETLNEAIKFHELEYLIIILSHPDKDHINLINKYTIPANLTIIVFCEGAWFHPKKQKAEDDDLKEIKKVLNFLKGRPNTYISFPYYWKGLDDNTNYQTIFGTFFDTKNLEGKVFELCKGKSIVPSPSFHDLQWLIPSSEVLKNIKIAHNFPFKDKNAQSAIVEIKMRKLGMRFILTGDAEKETFDGIEKKFFKKDTNLISFVMLNHHGSKNNISHLLFSLFEPDIIGVSGGEGGTYCIPSNEYIQLIKDPKMYDIKKYKADKTEKQACIEWIKKEYKHHFWEKFEITNNGFIQKDICDSIMAYEGKKKKEKGKKDAFIFDSNPGSMPILCTNLLGNIKIDNVGISVQFSDIIIDRDEIAYQINYLKHVDGIEGSIVQKDLGNNIVQDKDGNFYFRCEGNLYYTANKIGSKKIISHSSRKISHSSRKECPLRNFKMFM